MEYAVTLGFPTWSHMTAPCMMCTCTLANAYSRRGLSAVSLQWQKKTQELYDIACATCEVVVDPLTEPLWRKIRSMLVLASDAGPRGARGRVLMGDIPDCDPPLRKGDRLEPSPDCLHTGVGFDQQMPVRCVFWRSGNVSITHHRNPMFSGRQSMCANRLLVVG